MYVINNLFKFADDVVYDLLQETFFRFPLPTKVIIPYLPPHRDENSYCISSVTLYFQFRQ